MKHRLLDFVLSNSTWGDGELRVKFRQPFDLIALGATELKQKKAAGVGSDDLYQLKYTPEVSVSATDSRSECDSLSFGGILGGKLQSLWFELTLEQQQRVIDLMVDLVHDSDVSSLSSSSSS